MAVITKSNKNIEITKKGKTLSIQNNIKRHCFLDLEVM